MLFKANGDEEKALKALQSAVEMDKGWVDNKIRFVSWSLLGKSICLKGNYLNCEKVLEKALLLFPNDLSLHFYISETHHFLGLSLGYQGRLDEAISHIQKAIDFNPSNPLLYYAYGRFLFYKNEDNLQLALEQFEMVTNKTNDYNLWKSIVLFLFSVNKDEVAAEYCEKAHIIQVDLDEVCP